MWPSRWLSALSLRRSSGPKRAGHFGRCASAVLFPLRCSIFRAEREKGAQKKLNRTYSVTSIARFCLPFDRLRTNGSKVSDDHLCAVLPRGWQDRTQSKIEGAL